MTLEMPVRLAYRPAECAKLLGCSRELVFRLLEKGQLKGYKIGAARFVSAEELHRFTAERERVALEEV